MVIIFTLIIGGLGYVAWWLSAPFRFRFPMFMLFTVLLILVAGLAFDSIFLL